MTWSMCKTKHNRGEIRPVLYIGDRHIWHVPSGNDNAEMHLQLAAAHTEKTASKNGNLFGPILLGDWKGVRVQTSPAILILLVL